MSRQSTRRMRSRPRSRRSQGKVIKCMRPGPITRNPFLNYLREFRKENCGLTAVEVVVQGAQHWNQMSSQEKQKYISSMNTSGKCMRPGRITRNPYLNFLRQYRKENCGLSAVEIVVQGSQKWNAMSEEEKEDYIDQAQSAPQENRSRLRSRSRSQQRSRSGSRAGSRSRSRLRSRSRSGSRRSPRK